MIEIDLVNYTSNPERTVATAARACWKNKDYESLLLELSEQDVERIIRTVVSKNHMNVLEHVNFTFSISGISRVLSHQLVRHRIASYSQLSQQRSDSSDLEFTIPPEIQQSELFSEEYNEIVLHCQDVYRRLIRSGISRGSARYILPACFNTRVITTMNARSLFNLFAQRECDVEEWEFRAVAQLMHDRLMKVARTIFQFAGPSCQTHGYCPEGRAIIDCGGYTGVIRIDDDSGKQGELTHTLI